MKTHREISQDILQEFKNLPESEKREIELMGVMNDALEKALVKNGNVVLNLDEVVKLHVKSIAYYMGMSRHFDDLNIRAQFLAGLARDLMLMVSYSRTKTRCLLLSGLMRRRKKNHPLPSNMRIIEDDSDMSRPN